MFPLEKYKNILSYVMGIVLTISVITAAFGVKFKVNFKNSDREELKISLASYECNAEYIIKSHLQEKGINVEKIECNADITNTGSIYINVVTVYTSSEKKTVEEVLASDFDIKEVIVCDA